MSNKVSEIFDEAVREAHEEAGLQYAGLDDEGQYLWIGTTTQWENFIKLSNKQ